MTTMVDTADRLADSLRLLIPLAVDGPDLERERDVLARNVAVNMAFLALLDYDERRLGEEPLQPRAGLEREFGAHVGTKTFKEEPPLALVA